MIVLSLFGSVFDNAFAQLYHQGANAAAMAGGDRPVARPGATKKIAQNNSGQLEAGRVELLGKARQALFLAVR